MSLNFCFTEEQFGKISPLLPNKPRGVVGLVTDIFCRESFSACNATIAGRMYPPNTARPRHFAIATDAGPMPVFSNACSKNWRARRRIFRRSRSTRATSNRPTGSQRMVSKNTGEGRSVGKTKGGLNSKLHLEPTAGDRANISQFCQSLEHIPARDALSLQIAVMTPICATKPREVETIACIPPRKTARCSSNTNEGFYKTRNIVGRTFNRLKGWRQLSLRTFRGQKTLPSSPQRTSQQPSSGTYEAMPWAPCTLILLRSCCGFCRGGWRCL